MSHTLAGVWIEARRILWPGPSGTVTPSRVCGLKHSTAVQDLITDESHPRGCVD